MLKIMHALFVNYANIMHTFVGFVLHTFGIWQWKEPSKSTHVTEGDYSANITVNIYVQKCKKSKLASGNIWWILRWKQYLLLEYSVHSWL